MMAEDNAEKPAAPTSTSAGAGIPPSLKLYRSEELFGGARIVCIEHAGAIYRLQITSRGKLILQK